MKKLFIALLASAVLVIFGNQILILVDSCWRLAVTVLWGSIALWLAFGIPILLAALIVKSLIARQWQTAGWAALLFVPLLGLYFVIFVLAPYAQTLKH
jgi:hypothetical protein